MSGPVTYHLGKFPPQQLDWSRLIPLLGPAAAALARYDAMLLAIPNAAVLLSPMTTQEAVLSSRIEGTQATMGEVLEYEAADGSSDISDEKRADIEEVINYRQAMREAVNLLKELPLCNRLIWKLHEILLAGVRGHDKARGEFRTIQNYIGIYGRPVEEARFVPIAPEHLPDGMGIWERFVNDSHADALVQLALVHAEFESLHPFLDGNGRLGRILIPLFLFSKGLLREPMFYLSEYLEANRQEYYDRLLGVSQSDDWTGWCVFFLQAVERQARTNETKAKAILDLYEAKKRWIVGATHSQHAIAALDFMFNSPIFKSTDFRDGSDMPSTSAKRLLGLLKETDMLTTVREAAGSQPAVYAFAELLNIAEGRKIL